MSLFKRPPSGNERAASQRRAAAARVARYDAAASAPPSQTALAGSRTDRGAAHDMLARQTAVPVTRPRPHTTGTPIHTVAQTAASTAKTASNVFVAYLKASIAAAFTVMLLQTIMASITGKSSLLWLVLPIDKLGAIFIGPAVALSAAVPVLLASRAVRATGLAPRLADPLTGALVMGGPFILALATTPLSAKSLTMLGAAAIFTLGGLVGGYTFWKSNTSR